MYPCTERCVGRDIDDVCEKRHKEEGVADPVEDVPTTEIQTSTPIAEWLQSLHNLEETGLYMFDSTVLDYF